MTYYLQGVIDACEGQPCEQPSDNFCLSYTDGYVDGVDLLESAVIQDKVEELKNVLENTKNLKKVREEGLTGAENGV